MRMKTITTAWVTLVVALAASSSPAGTLNGTLKLGGVILDEEGDRSAVQETYTRPTSLFSWVVCTGKKMYRRPFAQQK